MKYLLALLLAAVLLPACADRSHNDQVTAVQPETPTVTMPAQLLNVFHDGHLYIVVLYNGGTSGGSILHSPSCPYDPLR